MSIHSRAPSISTSVARLDPVEDVPAPADVFADLIERSDSVCRNCYRRLGRRDEFPREKGYHHRDILAHVEEIVPKGVGRFDILDREYIESTLDEDRNLRVTPPTEQRATQSSRACWNCGAVDHHRTPDTRSKREAVDAAINVSVTLRELDVSHDWLLLVELVRQLKSRPSFAGDDFEVFSRAVEQAVAKLRE